MAERLVMGYWDCPYCGAKKIEGIKQDCPNCGHTRGEGTKFYMSGEKVYLNEEQSKTKGKGSDWLCSFCETYNPVTTNTCKNCGAPRDKDAKDYFEVSKAKKHEKREHDDYENNDDFAEKESENHIKESIHYVEEPEKDDKYTSNYHVSSENLTADNDKYFSLGKIKEKIASCFSIEGAVILLGVFAVIAVIACGIYALVPKPKTLVVEDVSWEYNIDIESYETVRESGWSVPSGGRVQYTREEVHHHEQVFDHYETKTRTYQERVQSGSHLEYSYSDNGDGTFTEHSHSVPDYEYVTKTETYEEPVYRDVPIYQTKYYYDIEKWIYKRSVTTSDSGHNPYYGETNLASNERESTKTEKYYVTAHDTKKEKTKKYSTEREIWDEIDVGDTIEVMISVNTITSFAE